MQEMVIYGISFDMVGRQPIVLLKSVTDNRFLPIWVGHPEAASILMKLQDADPPRPATHDLFVTALAATGGEVERVAITELKEKTFFAEIVVLHDQQEVQLDCRPSDALALAVRTEAPILVAEDILEETGIEFQHEDTPEQEDIVKEFKDFLQDVSPEDFEADQEDS